MTYNQLWQYSFLNNSLGQIVIAAIAFVFFTLLFYLVQKIILYRLEKVAQKAEMKAGDVFVHILASIKPPFYYFVAFYLGFGFLNTNEIVKKIFYIILIIAIVYQVILSIQIFIDYLVRRSMGHEREREAKSALSIIKTISSVILWSLGALFVFSNLGINITSLVAGLGIGGIAIALAMQNILKDLFSSFAIYLDKPFAIGDYIAVGKEEGIVKQIGVKTTRLRALQGEEIIISNQELTSARIQNFSKLKERRVTFDFKISSKTPKSRIEKIPGIVKELVKKIEDANFDQIYLTSFDKDSLNYELAYSVESNNYKIFLSVQEKVLLSLRETFEREKIDLA